jgi:integrase
MPDITDTSHAHATRPRTGRSRSGPRRGWREQIEPGLYRAHRLGCRSTIDRRPRRRCACPYEIQYPGRTPGRTTSSIVHGGLDEARAERRRRQSAPRQPIPSAEPAEVLLDDFAAQYFCAKAPVLAGATIRTREEDYRKRIAPSLGGLALSEITRERVAIWLADVVRSAPSSRMTTQTVATLRVILATALEWGRIETNPAAGLKVPNTTIDERPAITRVLDRTQLETLVAAASGLRIATILRTAGEAGLRKGEVIGLRWPDVVIAERRIEVKRAVWQEHPGKGQPAIKLEKPTKSGKARRVAISSRLAEDLAAWYSDSVATGGADPNGYVWPGKAGQAMDDCAPNHLLRRTQQRAGLIDDLGKPLVTFHGLRHTAASIMLSRDVPLIVVSRQLGHANPHITATIYAHLLGDSELDLAAQAFE